MKNTSTRPASCHVCNAVPVARRRADGCGMFWACPGCAIPTWNYRDGKLNNDPAMVARGSIQRGRCTSQRELLKTQLLVRGKVASEDEASEFIDAFGLEETRKLLAA